MPDETPAPNGTTTTTTPPPTPAPVVVTAPARASDRMVPHARFAEVVAERKRLEGDLAVRDAKIAELDTAAKTAGTLAADLAAAREELGLVRAGLTDPEAVDVARALYARAPAEGKPATVAEYVAGFRAEGAVVPKALAPYLTPAVAAAAAATAVGEPAAKAPLPKAPNVSKDPPAATEPITAETIRTLTAEAQRTRDYSKLQAAQPAIDAWLARKR